MTYNLRSFFLIAISFLFLHAANSQDKVMAIAEYMPSLDGCETIKDRAQRGDCTREKISVSLSENLKLPKEMRDAGVISGAVVVEIVVDKEGDVSDMKIVDDPGYGMADAAIKALKKLNKSWHPAEHFGEKVSAKIAVPVQFVLPESEEHGDESAAVAVNTDKVYQVVETMPAWSGCTGDNAKNCTFEAFTTYFMENLKYPEEAKAEGVEGMVQTQFVIDEKGNVTQVEVIEGIGSGCDEEAIRLIKSMPTWIPGKQRDVPVKVEMNVPVRFKLRTKE